MKKLMNKKAFTIMEMLIVVAIIAVLVAIAIPTFSGALTKAKDAADVANVRAAYAETVTGYLVGDDAFPASASAAETAIESHIEGTLNHDGLKVVAETTGENKTETGRYIVTFTALKLANGSTAPGVWTWTLENPNIA